MNRNVTGVMSVLNFASKDFASKDFASKNFASKD